MFAIASPLGVDVSTATSSATSAQCSLVALLGLLRLRRRHACPSLRAIGSAVSSDEEVTYPRAERVNHTLGPLGAAMSI
jgi:hypothetical protein